MATQIKMEELSGCKSYLTWLREKSDISLEIAQTLLEIDFEWSLKEDEIRARDAQTLRKEYANEVGNAESKNKREIDRIWKSICGKCSLLELFVSMAKHIDQMVNEGEEGQMIPVFMKIFLENTGILGLTDHEEIKAKGEIMIARNYADDGSNGCIFVVSKPDIRMPEICLWDQMGLWLDEHILEFIDDE